MTSLATTDTGWHARSQLMPFLTQEYLRVMRGPLAKLIWAMMLYAVVATPFIMAKPPPEIVHAIKTWLGPESIGSKVVLFMWVDAAMNKLAMVLGPALAGGIMVDERSRGFIDLVAAKPVSAESYFVVKLAAALAAFATFYTAATLGALAIFSRTVDGFAAGDFLALSVVHVFAGLFAVSLSGTMAVLTGRKLAGMLLSLVILGTLVGFAFLGFYYPSLRWISYLNPFFQGVVLIGSLDGYGQWDILRPIAVLIAFNLIVAWFGRRHATRRIAGG
jgi:ABC-type transport system involved in multi-copper enzyme maturation permease subunit